MSPTMAGMFAWCTLVWCCDVELLEQRHIRPRLNPSMSPVASSDHSTAFGLVSFSSLKLQDKIKPASQTRLNSSKYMSAFRDIYCSLVSFSKSVGSVNPNLEAKTCINNLNMWILGKLGISTLLFNTCMSFLCFFKYMYLNCGAIFRSISYFCHFWIKMHFLWMRQKKRLASYEITNSCWLF